MKQRKTVQNIVETNKIYSNKNKLNNGFHGKAKGGNPVRDITANVFYHNDLTTWFVLSGRGRRWIHYKLDGTDS